MNVGQRVALALGLLIAAAMCLMTPWQTPQGVDAGYAFLLAPPSNGAPLGGLPEIARSRLLVQILALASATGAIIVVLGQWRRA